MTTGHPSNRSIVMKQSHVLEHVCQLFPAFVQYTNTPRNTVTLRTNQIEQIQDYLRQPEVEQCIWFTVGHIIERMHYSMSNGVQLYDVPASGDVFHSIELCVSSSLLSCLYYGTARNPCPVEMRMLTMCSWNSLLRGLPEGTYDFLSREVYWLALYGVSHQRPVFRNLVEKTSTSSECALWETSTTRSILQSASYNNNKAATQWLNAVVATA